MIIRFAAICIFLICPSTAFSAPLTHSFSQPEKIQTKHTHLDLTIDFDRKIVRGAATIKALRLKGNEFILDTADLNIQQIIDEYTDKPLLWKKIPNPEASATGFGEALSIQVPDPANIYIRIEYESSPNAPGLVWMNPEQTRSGEPFFFAMNEPIGARSWFPCQDTPAVRSTYSADLKIEAKNRTSKEPLMALLSGTNNPKKSNPAMEYKNLISQKVPIPTYLLVIAAGRFTYEKISDSIGYYADNPKTLSDAKKGLKDVPKYFDALRGMLGHNPWQNQDFLFLPAMFAYGGMENPCLIYINEAMIEPTGASAFIMAHELAHQWTGNIVTNKTWQDFWLNEGWTTYIENRVLAAVHGKEFSAGQAYERHLELLHYAEQQRTNSMDPVAGQLTQLYKVGINSVHPDALLDYSVYSKGATLLATIEEIIGRTAFDLYAKSYIKKFNQVPVDTAAFTKFTIEKLAPIKPDIDWTTFLQDWINKPGISPSSSNPMVAAAISKVTPTCEGCSARFDEFNDQREKTHFTKWNCFHLRYLLKIVEMLLSTDQQLGSRMLSDLKVNPSFQTKIAPHIQLLAPWYQLLIKADLWEDHKDAIRTFLSTMGRGRAIQPLYFELMNGGGASFAGEVFQANRNRYFSSVRRSLEVTFEKSKSTPAEL